MDHVFMLMFDNGTRVGQITLHPDWIAAADAAATYDGCKVEWNGARKEGVVRCNGEWVGHIIRMPITR